jgi:hypothetical protein
MHSVAGEGITQIPTILPYFLAMVALLAHPTRVGVTILQAKPLSHSSSIAGTP